MAEIDKTFYRGTDQYSDGDEAEETIMQIVREGRDFYDIEQMSWPTFYHLNPVRENICNWYPFEPGSRVLEIGAGCGAVTGALCGKGLDIFSVDLSLRRSTINYERHKSCKDLHLIVGNLNEITFPEPFDYILLIGVLEYAGRFTGGEHSYQSFLKNIRRWLKDEGKLLIAIENRIGLKYFAGAGEDHLGIPFAGLKGYPEDRGIRTFSRSEMERLLQKSGYRGFRFYYPYPDYKLPEEIFTEKTFCSRHYGKPYHVYDLDRADLFPETEMAKTLHEEQVAGAFANSFLVVATNDLKALNRLQIYYAKLNRGRREAFQTGIKIYGDTEPQMVSRFALTEAADEHIIHIAENERRMARERNVLQGSREGFEILYPYLASGTMEDTLREAELNQERGTIIHIFQQIRVLAEIKPESKSYESEQFTEWFGKERIVEREPVCTEIANINLMPDNIFEDQGQMIISDCEWVTDFAVPVSFLTWHCVEKTYENHSLLQKILPKQELQQILEIPEENISVYQKWSQHFEYQYVSKKNLAGFAKTREITDFYPAQEKAKDNEIIRQQEEIRELAQSKRELEEKVKELEEKANQQDRVLKEVLSSHSWRATAVFRTAREKITGAKNKS